MLYIKEVDGTYTPALTPVVLQEAKARTARRLRRGAPITDQNLATEAIAVRLRHLDHEVFACLWLDASYRIIEFKIQSEGSVASNSVYSRQLVKEALRLNAAAVIFAHNHPSGGTEPSKADRELTQKLKEILRVIDANVIDHIIVGDHNVSMADMGLI